MLRIIPMEMIPLISELNPELRKGSGIPVFGKIEVATPMFTKTWNINIEAMPTEINMPNRSGAFFAVSKHL